MKRLKIKHVHTTGSTPPNVLEYGEIGITHNDFSVIDDVKNKRITCGPRIYTLTNVEDNKNKLIQYVSSEEIDRRLSGLSENHASTSEYGPVKLISGDTYDFMKNLSIPTTLRRQFFIKPRVINGQKNASGESVYDYTEYFMTASPNIITAQTEEIIIKLTDSNNSNYIYISDAEIVCERLGGIFPEIIFTQKINNGTYQTYPFSITDDSCPYKFTLKSGNTILNEIVVESLLNPDIKAGTYFFLSNNNMVVPVEENYGVIKDTSAQTKINVYKNGERVQKYNIKIFNTVNGLISSTTVDEAEDDIFSYDVSIKNEDNIFYPEQYNFTFLVEIDGTQSIKSWATSVLHNHDTVYVEKDVFDSDITSAMTEIKETILTRFGDFAKDVDVNAWTLNTIHSNLNDILSQDILDKFKFTIDAKDFNVDENSKDVLGIKKEPTDYASSTDPNKPINPFNIPFSAYTKTTINHIRNKNKDFKFKINDNTQTEFTDEFNNIRDLPLNTGHIVGEYVNILTADVEGIEFKMLDDNDNLIEEFPEFIIAGKEYNIDVTLLSGYSITELDANAGFKLKTVTKNDETGNEIYHCTLTTDNNVKITASCTRKSDNKKITDEKLTNKKFKNYYYQTYKYDYKPATQNENGAVRMFGKITYDDNTSVKQPFCANHVHKHKDYFHINRDNYDEENPYIISATTGFELINCGSY